MSDRDKAASTTRLLEQLRRNQAFHVDGAAGVERELGILQSWQSARLARTYADLLASPRYRPAAEFFLDELYGNRDLRQREHDLARIVPVMTRVLPAIPWPSLGHPSIAMLTPNWMKPQISRPNSDELPARAGVSTAPAESPAGR